MNSRLTLLETLAPYLHTEQKGELWSNVYYEVILRSSDLLRVQIHTRLGEEEWSVKMFDDVSFEVAYINGEPKDRNAEVIPGIILSFLETQL